MPLIGSSGNYRKFIFENKKGILLFAVTVFYIFYLVLGGYIFYLVEGPEEIAQKNAVLKAKEETLKRFPKVPEEALDYFAKQLAANGVKGIPEDNSTIKWTIGNSVLFAATLLTTIGYGHLSAISPLGKILSMFYSTIGILLTLFVFSMYVDRLQRMSNFFLESLYYRLKSRLSFMRIRLIHFSIIMVFIIVGCFLFPAYIFSSLELTWSYFDSVYFCFISLTTIGLGDFVPGLNMKHPLVDLYRFGSSAYLLIGVIFMMFALAEITDFAKNFNKPYQEALLSREKQAIRSDDRPPSYGTIVVQVTKTDDDETKTLLP